MNSGKSTALLQKDHSLREAGFQTYLMKRSTDTREPGVIKSRLGIQRPCLIFRDFYEFYTHLAFEKIGTVLIDEAQFLDRDLVERICSMADQERFDVIFYGLRTSYTGELFPGSAAIMALADELVELPQIYRDGEKSIMHVRYIDGKPVFNGNPVHVGDIKEDYESVSRRRYYELRRESIVTEV